jgi:hypothetical protein
MGPMGAAMPKGAQGKRKKAKEVTGKKKERKQDRKKEIFFISCICVC